MAIKKQAPNKGVPQHSYKSHKTRKVIGDHLRQARHHEELTQEETARRLKTGRRGEFVGRIERGLTGQIETKELFMLLRALGVNPLQFFKDTGLVSQGQVDAFVAQNAPKAVAPGKTDNVRAFFPRRKIS